MSECRVQCAVGRVSSLAVGAIAGTTSRLVCQVPAGCGDVLAAVVCPLGNLQQVGIKQRRDAQE
jgi:hypothetical protein